MVVPMAEHFQTRLQQLRPTAPSCEILRHQFETVLVELTVDLAHLVDKILAH